ncbi:MAG: hypothetical protein AAF432_00660 [Planctomycetota bacterium]
MGDCIDALDKIHPDGGHAWDKVEDPEGFVREIRGESPRHTNITPAAPDRANMPDQPEFQKHQLDELADELHRDIINSADHIPDAGKMVDTIDTGDTVLHRPTGETWVVAFVQGDQLAWVGWPNGRADLADCELVVKAHPTERMELLREMADMRNGDCRRRYARRILNDDTD